MAANTELEDLNRYIAEQFGFLMRHRKFIADLKASGRDVANADRMLASIQNTLLGFDRPPETAVGAAGQVEVSTVGLRGSCLRLAKEHCGIGRSWAYELLAIGGGTKTEEGSRAKNAEANRRYRESPSRDGLNDDF